MEQDGTEQERNNKKEEQERNDLAEGPRSRTERNDLKKVGTCPTLGIVKVGLYGLCTQGERRV